MVFEVVKARPILVYLLTSFRALTVVFLADIDFPSNFVPEVHSEWKVGTWLQSRWLFRTWLMPACFSTKKRNVEFSCILFLCYAHAMVERDMDHKMVGWGHCLDLVWPQLSIGIFPDGRDADCLQFICSSWAISDNDRLRRAWCSYLFAPTFVLNKAISSVNGATRSFFQM